MSLYIDRRIWLLHGDIRLSVARCQCTKGSFQVSFSDAAASSGIQGVKTFDTMLACYKQCGWIQFVRQHTTFLLLHEIVCV